MKANNERSLAPEKSINIVDREEGSSGRSLKTHCQALKFSTLTQATTTVVQTPLQGLEKRRVRACIQKRKWAFLDEAKSGEGRVA